MEILKKNQRASGRWWAKTDEGWMLLARAVWIIANGPIPKGYVIHHVDENRANDTLQNLQALTRTEHFKIHHPINLELSRQRLRDARQHRGPVSLATREKMRQGKTGLTQSRETVEKRRLANTGKKRSPEQCLRLKEAALLRWQIKHNNQ